VRNPISTGSLPPPAIPKKLLERLEISLNRRNPPGADYRLNEAGRVTTILGYPTAKIAQLAKQKISNMFG
jgi:hypothetical protein